MKKNLKNDAIIVFLVFILSLANCLVYSNYKVKIDTKRTWGTCSIRFSVDSKKDNELRSKCLKENERKIAQAEGYISNYGDISKYLAGAFIIISIIIVITVPQIAFKLLSILTVLINTIVLII